MLYRIVIQFFIMFNYHTSSVSSRFQIAHLFWTQRCVCPIIRAWWDRPARRSNFARSQCRPYISFLLRKNYAASSGLIVLSSGPISIFELLHSFQIFSGLHRTSHPIPGWSLPLPDWLTFDDLWIMDGFIDQNCFFTTLFLSGGDRSIKHSFYGPCFAASKW